MRVLHAASYRRMAWKNGGGETAEIAVFPAEAGLESFGWRVSMAGVAADGPFSPFAGVERTLSVLEGDGIVLEIAGRPAVRLTPSAPPHRFAADAATYARLVGGPIVDLNVMTRRGRFDHRVTRHEIDGQATLTSQANETVLFCAGQDLRIVGAGSQADLGRYDAAMFTGANTFRVEGSGRIFAIELHAGGLGADAR